MVSRESVRLRVTLKNRATSRIVGAGRKGAVMSAATGVIVLVGRVLFAGFFGTVAGVGHFRRSKQMEEYSKGIGFPVPSIAGWPTGLWLIVGAGSIALGIWPDVGALMIAAFLVPAAWFFHRYWTVADPMQKMT